MGKHQNKLVRSYFIKQTKINTKNDSYGCKFCAKLYIMNVTRMRKHLEGCFKCPSAVKKKFKLPQNTRPTSASGSNNTGTGTRSRLHITSSDEDEDDVSVVSHVDIDLDEEQENVVMLDEEASCSESSTQRDTVVSNHSLRTESQGYEEASCSESSTQRDTVVSNHSLRTESQGSQSRPSRSVSRNSWPQSDRSVSRHGSLDSFIDHMPSEEEAKVWEIMARAIYATDTPLSIVENPYWKDVFKKLRPSFTLPSRYMVSNPLLQAEYNRVNTIVKSKIDGTTTLGMQCDAWSNLRNESIITFVVTTPSPTVYKTIHTKADRHTGEYMAQIMGEVMVEIGVQKIIGIVTDNAAPMVKAWRLLGDRFSMYHITYYGCIAHTLNLFIGDIMKHSSFVKVEVTCKEIINCVKYSQRLTAIFKSIQESKKGKRGIRSLLLPVKTRWGSIVACLESLVKTKYALQSLAITEEVDDKIMNKRLKNIILDDEFWNKVATTLSLLKPIRDLIIKLETDKPCLSMVPEAFRLISESFQWNLVSSPVSAGEKKKIEQSLQIRKEQALKPLHFAANILDPHYIGKSLGTGEDVDGVEYIHALANSLPNISARVILHELAEYKAKEGLWAKTFVWENITNNDHSDRQMDPLTWWKGICNSSSLSKIAIIVLSLPATSAATERSFSTFGAIHTKKRNRLTTKRASMLMHVSHNLKIERRTEKEVQKNESESENETDSAEDEDVIDVENENENCDEPDPTEGSLFDDVDVYVGENISENELQNVIDNVDEEDDPSLVTVTFDFPELLQTY